MTLPRQRSAVCGIHVMAEVPDPSRQICCHQEPSNPIFISIAGMPFSRSTMICPTLRIYPLTLVELVKLRNGSQYE